MKTNNIEICFVSDDNCHLEIYEKILNKNDLCINRTFQIQELEENHIDEHILIVDILNKKSINYFKSANINSDTKIFFISNYENSFFEDKSNYYHFFKPLDTEYFFNLLNFNIINLNRQNFINDEEKILLNLIEQCPFNMAIFNLNSKLVYANKKYLQFSNYKVLNENNTFDEFAIIDLSFEKIIIELSKQDLFTYEFTLDNKHYLSYFYFINDGNFLIQVLQDITSTKEKMSSLEKTALFFEKSTEAVVITDEQGKIIASNNAFSRITGFSKNEIIGQKTSILKSGMQDNFFYKSLWEKLKYTGKWQGEIWNRKKNGEVYPEWLSITRIKNESTNETNYMALFTDVTSIKQADEKLHFYAKYDHLTGLLNRAQFENMLKYVIDKSERSKSKFALMFIDLDNFKDINDTFGHDIGDLMLINISRRIKETLRKEDIIARIGGDEFNILIENVKDPIDAIEVAQKINKNIKKEIHIEDYTFDASLSIGIAIYPDHGDNSTALIKNADSAMYEVKKNGRDNFMLYDKKFTQKLLKKVSIQNKLKKAIKNEDFIIYYQPIICLKTQKIIGAEALIRWFDGDKFISPEIFIPIAENHGMISQIGDFVMKQSFKDLKNILKYSTKDFKLSINISSREFLLDDYISKLLKNIKKYEISPTSIELEITETYIMKNYDIAIEKIKILKDKGFSFAIDDFGTGYSSLSYLKKFPMNKLKIDKSFVSDILKDKDDQLIVETIVNVAKVFDFELQAEGIECYEHSILLEKMGCDLAQGYFFSKPISLDDFIEFLRKENENSEFCNLESYL